MATVSGADRSQDAAWRHRPGAIVLHALLSFHQETALTLPTADPRAGDEDGRAAAASSCSRPIGTVDPRPWHGPRNAASPSGVPRRRWTDHSPRFPQRQTFRPKRQGGQIESAFGFDLTPLVARAEEIENLAEKCGPRTRRYGCCANASRCSAAISSR